MNNGKSVIKSTDGQLRIVIPSKKNWFVLCFGTFWLTGWGWGIYSVGKSLLYFLEKGEINYFLIVWLIAWFIGGSSVISVVLWGFFGKEKLIVDGDQVKFQKTVFGLGKRRKLNKKEMKNLRKHEVCSSLFSGCQVIPYGLNTGKIRFDHGMRTYSLGLSLDEAEVNHILSLLEEYQTPLCLAQNKLRISFGL